MASVNNSKKSDSNITTTHGGAKTITLRPIDELERTVLSSLLFESQHYENGEDTALRIKRLVPLVTSQQIISLTIKARKQMNLRHVPLYLAILMLKDKNHKQFVRRLIQEIVFTTGQATELVALYWKENERKFDKKTNKYTGKKNLAAQLKKGLADRVVKFDAYQLAKDKKHKVLTIKDVIKLCHPKGTDLIKSLLDGTLPPPETWEVLISRAGSDKTKRIAAWNKLMENKSFPEDAFLKNLRNMEQDGVDVNTIKNYFTKMRFNKTLPYQFMAAAEYAPTFKSEIEIALCKSFSNTVLDGDTLIVLDMSGSMAHAMSDKSKMSRLDSAYVLAMILNYVCTNPTFYATAGNDSAQQHATTKVKPEPGFKLADSFRKISYEIGHGGIFLTQVMDYIDQKETKVFDRVIVINDEQDCDHDKNKAPALAKVLGSKNNYIMNVAAYSTGFGVEYKQKWTHINGFSNYVCKYIAEYENFINSLE